MLSPSKTKPWPDRRKTDVIAGWMTKRNNATIAVQTHQGYGEDVARARRVRRAASTISMM